MTSSDSVVIDLIPVATKVEVINDNRELPVSTKTKATKKRPPLGIELKKLTYEKEIDEDYYITKLCIYYASKTCIVLTMLTVLVIVSIYISQAFYLMDIAPDNILKQARDQFMTSACNPETDKSCKTDMRSCYIINSITTCKGGETPP